MVKVYCGYDLILGCEVVIKIFDWELVWDMVFCMCFWLEVQVVFCMLYLLIVCVYDVGDFFVIDSFFDELLYIVMELVKGILFKDIIVVGLVLVVDVVCYVDGIFEVFDYLYCVGVVYCDIKLGNVMVIDKGQVKVMDFGIVCVVFDFFLIVVEIMQIIGIVVYFLFEQVKGEFVDVCVDLYFIGVVFYELFIGCQLFCGEFFVVVVYQYVSEMLVLLIEVNEDVLGVFDLIVLCVFVKDFYQCYLDVVYFCVVLDVVVIGNVFICKQLGVFMSELYGLSLCQVQEMVCLLCQFSIDMIMMWMQLGFFVVWIWVGVVLFVVFLVFVVFWVFMISMCLFEVLNFVWIMLDFVNVFFECVLDDLVKFDMIVKVVIELSMDIVEGNVISIDFEVGVFVEEGLMVILYVFLGEEMVVMLKIEGMFLDVVMNVLKLVGFLFGIVIFCNDKGLVVNIVIFVSEDVDVEFVFGMVVNLVVVSGKVIFMNFVGWIVDVVLINFLDFGLILVFVEQGDCFVIELLIVYLMLLVFGDVFVGMFVELCYCMGEQLCGWCLVVIVIVGVDFGCVLLCFCC